MKQIIWKITIAGNNNKEGEQTNKLKMRKWGRRAQIPNKKTRHLVHFHVYELEINKSHSFLLLVPLFFLRSPYKWQRYLYGTFSFVVVCGFIYQHSFLVCSCCCSLALSLSLSHFLILFPCPFELAPKIPNGIMHGNTRARTIPQPSPQYTRKIFHIQITVKW